MRATCHLLLPLSLLVAGSGATAQAATPWPTGPGTEIGLVGTPDHLPPLYQPSGVVWHPGRARLLVVDDGGLVSEMTAAGDSVVTWTVGGDLEGIALPDRFGDIAYLGLESPDSVLEFDLSTGALTGNSWDLTPWMTGPFNRGLEALTVANGLVYAGLQATGEIFVFELLAGDSVVHHSTIPSPLGFDDVAGLDFDSQTSTLFALYDTENLLFEMSVNGFVYRDYVAIGNDQEGFALVGGGAPGVTAVYIAEDSSELWRYEGYPITWATDVGPGGDRGLGPIASARAYPNPFRERVQLRAPAPAAGAVRWTVHDATGRTLRRLDAPSAAGAVSAATWNGRDDRGQPAPAGVYFLRAQSSAGSHVVKVVRAR